MPSSTPHQKFCFYHLPTRGRARIKLGDAWYVSNVSIIFDCSMLYYLLFWTLLVFIIHFYIIFGTTLLTGGPAQYCYFFAYFRVSQKKNIKWSPNGMKPLGTWFSEQTWSRGLGPYIKTSNRRPRGRGGRLPPQARPPPSWAPCCSTDVLLPPIYIHVPPNNQIRSQNPNSTTATFCIHEIPSWGLFRSSVGGGIHHGGLLHHHHSPSDEVWVIYLGPTGP